MNNMLIMLISIILSAAAIWGFIPILRKKNYGQFIRVEGNEEHYKKAGTPTMGGLAFTMVFIIIALIATNFNINILFVILTTFLFGLIGFIDDYSKIAKKQNLGLTERQKLILQFGIAFIIVFLQYFILDVNIGNLDIPFLSRYINIGILSIPFLMFVIVGTVNATNLTDGLDGLLSYVSVPVFICVYILAGNTNPEVATAALIFTGVLLGFIVFNSHPASIFMGDTGSMAIGGALASMLIILNKPIYLIFLGAIYVVEALSVMAQVVYYKKYGKRLFRMAPIHHHFEKLGFKETKIVSGMTVVSIMLCLITLWIA